MPVMTTRLSFMVSPANLPALAGPRKQSSRLPSLHFVSRHAAGALDQTAFIGLEGVKAEPANDPTGKGAGLGPHTGCPRNDGRHEDENHRHAHRQNSELSEGQAHVGLG
jgi:hypothetical protein